MKYIKNLGISMGYIILFILVSTFLVTLLHYFNLLPTKLVSVLKILILIFSLLIGGIKIGKESNEKGWLEGLKLGIIFLVILVLFKYLGLSDKFLVKDLLYYLILLVTSTFGSIIGINYFRKKTT